MTTNDNYELAVSGGDYIYIFSPIVEELMQIEPTGEMPPVHVLFYLELLLNPVIIHSPGRVMWESKSPTTEEIAVDYAIRLRDSLMEQETCADEIIACHEGGNTHNIWTVVDDADQEKRRRIIDVELDIHTSYLKEVIGFRLIRLGGRYLHEVITFPAHAFSVHPWVCRVEPLRWPSEKIMRRLSGDRHDPNDDPRDAANCSDLLWDDAAYLQHIHSARDKRNKEGQC